MPTIPDALWRESDRPLAAWLIRAAVALVPILIGWVLVNFVAAVGVYGWGLAVLGLALFFVVPSIADATLLTPFARRVDAADRSKAHALLDELRANKPINALAPHGFLRLQEAKLYLAVDDHRAAAKAFAEAERVSTHAGHKTELISAQAHALTLAGDRKPARELLARLTKLDALTDLDHFNYGIVLLSESGHNKDALDHLLAARESFGEHPRLLAALVLAHQRCEQTEQAAALLEQAEAAVEASGDQLAADLLKRGKKGLRPLLKSKQKRERKVETGKATGGQGKAEKAPKGKKGRKQARRDARKKAKASARRSPEEAAAAALEQGGEAAEEAAERDEALAEAGEEAKAADTDDRPDVDDSDASDDDEHEGDADDSDDDEHEGDADDSDDDESADDSADECADEPDEAKDTNDDQAAASQATEPRAADSQATTEITPPLEPVTQPTSSESVRDLIASLPSTQPDKPAKASDDLANLVREAMSSGVRPKLEDEPRASTSGIRPIEPAASSGSMFRSALFNDEPEPEEVEKPKSSLFSMPSFGDLPTFAPPPKPSRGPLLPPKSSESSSESSESSSSLSNPKPSESAAPAVKAPPISAPAVKAPAISAPPISAPAIRPPPISAPTPTVPSPSAPTAKPPTPAIDDDWGDLGDVFAPAPAKPADDGEGSP